MKQYKCTIIFGSPRKNGNTFSLLEPFIDQLQKNGVMVQLFDVYEQHIEGCRVCLECQKKKDELFCAVRDDMIPVLHAMAEADLIVYAAPVYLWAAPAPVKAVMDRSVYSACKYYGDDPHGPSLLAGKKLALITTCGYPVEKGADLFEEMMKRYCKHCRMDYAGMLAERHRNLKEPFMDSGKEKRAREFADQLSVAPSPADGE